MRRYLLIIFFTFTFFIDIYAQKQWTLQQCIDTALQNNIQIKQQQISTEISKINWQQSKVSLLPNLNGSVSHVYNYGRTIDMFTNEFATERVLSQNFYLSTGVTLFNGFQLLNNIKQSYYAYMAGKSDLERSKNDLILTIATSYLQVLYNIEILENAKNQVELSKQQIIRTKKLVDAGTVPQGTLMVIESQAANEEYQRVIAENQLKLAYLNLSQIMDLQSSDDFEIEKPIITTVPDSNMLTSPSKVLEEATKHQPEILSAEYRVKAAEKTLHVAQGSRFPSLALRGSYGTGYSGASKQFVGLQDAGNKIIGWTMRDSIPVLSPSFTSIYEKKPFDTQIDDNLNKSIGFYLTIPLFNNWQSNNNIKKAKLNYRNSQLNLDLTKNNLRKTIFQAYFDAKAALNRYYAAEKSVASMEESFKYTQQRFDIGLVNSIDYNDAKTKLSTAKSNLIQAKYEFVFRLKVLEFYQGKTMTL